MTMKTPDMSDVVPLGTFEEQVMLAVLRTAGEAYAMAVRRELEEVTRRTITIGSIYVTLDRLESKALITSTRTSRDASSSRRLFAVTSLGAHALAATRAMRERLWDGVELRALLRA
jgi:PadR family transcriptional regulator, regulatory protein PadR